MSSPAEPLRPVSLRDQVYARVQTMLIERELEPGAHVVETELASRLGVSRGPVREALQLLERDGWIELRPRQGAFVHDPTEREISDFFEVRRLVEGESARLAAQRGARLSGETLGEILNRAHRAMDESRSGSELAGLTAEFHRGVTQLSSNSLLDKIAHQLAGRTLWYLRPLVSSISRRAWAEHAAIHEAIAAGDDLRAERAAQEHVAWSWDRYLAWRAVQESPSTSADHVEEVEIRDRRLGSS